MRDQKRFRKFDPETNEPKSHWYKDSNDNIEFFTERRFSGQLQQNLVMLIRRETYSADPPRPWVQLSIGRLAKKFGKSRQAMTDAVEDAVARGLIEFQQIGTSAMRKQSVKRYRITQWSHVPRYVPSDSESVESTVLTFGNQMVLFPGRHSNAIRIEGTRNGLPIEAEIEYHNEFGQPLCFAAEFTDRGTIAVSILPKQETGANKHQTYVKSTRQQFADSSPFVVENNEVFEKGLEIQKNGHLPRQRPFQFPLKKRPDPPSAPSPEANGSEPTSLPADSPNELKRFRIRGEYRDFLSALLMEAWGIALKDDYLSLCINAADGMPVEGLHDRLVVRFGKAYGKPLSKHTPGLLLGIVGDAVIDWKARNAVAEPAEPQISKEEFREWALTLPAEDYGELVNKGVLDGDR